MKNYLNQSKVMSPLQELINEKVSELIQILDSDLLIHYINQQVHINLLGYEEYELVDENFLNFVQDSQKEKLEKFIKEGFDDQKDRELRFNLKDKYDNHYVVRGKISYFRNKFDEQRGLLVLTLIDSVLKKDCNKKINISEIDQKYDSLINKLGNLFFWGANDSIFIMDQDKFIEANRKTLDLFGLKNKDEIIGRSPWDYSPQKQLDGSNSKIKGTKLINKALNGKPQRFNWTHIKKDGSPFQAEISLNAFKFEDKSFLQAIVRDITEKIKAERRLKESEEKFRHLFENSPFSIVLLKPNGKIIDCNPALKKLTGYAKEELIGLYYTKVPFIKDDIIPTLKDRRKRFLGGETLTPIEIEIVKKDGKKIWIEIESTSVDVGHEHLIQIIAHNISDRKNAENILKEEYKRLLELNKMRKDLISRVSHELKTPLMSVKGASELLLLSHNEELNQETLELVEMIKKGGERLTNLVDNLIDISRIEYNKIQLNKSKTDLVKLIKETADDMKFFLKKRELSLNLDLPNSLKLNIDNFRIEQVIANLLSNAIKNTPPEGEIIISLKQNSKWAKISVSDTGIGLTDEEMDRIFTRFGKIERHGPGLEFMDIQGSGLGLYISREIVSLHKGKIFAKSEGRHKGSTFKVHLPLRRQN
ncbi:MAG: putative Histidine kinase [Promethearchaeota archaeon]|nr:MAG: putative Histidine kinase [Candidatus Lokiarchaeota archaeon]